MKKNTVLIIGGGAAGMMAAISAAESGASVILLERNSRLGRKLMITGKGRCNITNKTDLSGLIGATVGNGRFLYSAYSRFTPQDMVDFFQNEGLSVKVERGNRVFPVSDRSVDVVDCLVNKVRSLGVFVAQGRAKNLMIENNTVVGAATEDGKVYLADRVIICTGGASYPATGSTGDGYSLARQAGHTVMPLRPSLVPLESPDPACKEMQGLSLRNVKLCLLDAKKKKELFSDFGEMLFTHFGVSGPLVLSASSHIRQMESNRYRLDLDLKPALDDSQLDNRLIRDFTKYQNRDFHHLFDDLLPRKMIPVFVKKTGIDSSCKGNQVTKEMRLNIIHQLKHFEIEISKFRPIEEAIVTAGGVSIKEINPKTMASKRIRNLFFAGEILDVDAYTGGFNLQIAWSTGFLAGKYAADLNETEKDG